MTLPAWGRRIPDHSGRRNHAGVGLSGSFTSVATSAVHGALIGCCRGPRLVLCASKVARFGSLEPIEYAPAAMRSASALGPVNAVTERPRQTRSTRLEKGTRRHFRGGTECFAVGRSQRLLDVARLTTTSIDPGPYATSREDGNRTSSSPAFGPRGSSSVSGAERKRPETTILRLLSTNIYLTYNTGLCRKWGVGDSAEDRFFRFLT